MTDTCHHTGQTWHCASSVTLWFDFIDISKSSDNGDWWYFHKSDALT
jgi:hypothetical protein